MNHEFAQLKRVTGSHFFTKATALGVVKVFTIAVISGLLCSAAAMADGDDPAFLPTQVRAVSTVPANGDQNPYGVAFVPPGFPAGGPLSPGDILVSNFNASSNLQGTGTTIVRITPSGQQSLFFQFQGTTPVGLTTALGVLRDGFVLVGNVPTQTVGMTTSVVPPGSLLVLDRFGHVVETLSSSTLLDGPWDLTIHEKGDHAQVFVSNVLSGTVTRLDLKAGDGNKIPAVQSEIQIASGYTFRTDPAALVVGPTGLAYNKERDVLYVASTGDNTIFAIDHASSTQKDNGTGRAVYSDSAHLRGPLGLVLAPNGNLISANGDAVNSPDPTKPQQNFLVEFTQAGNFVAQFQLDSGSTGADFGLAIKRSGDTIRFAAVDDDLNKLNIWSIPNQDSHDEHE